MRLDQAQTVTQVQEQPHLSRQRHQMEQVELVHQILHLNPRNQAHQQVAIQVQPVLNPLSLIRQQVLQTPRLNLRHQTIITHQDLITNYKSTVNIAKNPNRLGCLDFL